MVSYLSGPTYPQEEMINLVSELIEKDCCVCFEEFDESDAKKTPITIRCNHVFCKSCLMEWEKKDLSSPTHYTCPLCRRGYKKKDPSGFEKIISALFSLMCCSGTPSRSHDY